MKAVILAAGQGNRLEHLTDDKPKALVKVCGRELLRYQIDFLQGAGIPSIALVGGYLFPVLKRFAEAFFPAVRLFENPDFTHGSILTLQKALPFLDDDFLLMNVDHIYPKRLFGRLFEQIDGITAICDFDRKLVADDMKVKLDGNRCLRKIHKQLDDHDGGYIGMLIVPKAKIPVYLQSIEQTLARLGPKVSVEMILGELTQREEPVSIADVSGIHWLEVDTLEDLQKAEEMLKASPEFLK